MNVKKLLSTTIICGAIFVSTQSANAKPGFEVTLNAALGTTGLSCNACHATSPQNEKNATLSIASTWRINNSASNLAGSDSDLDGFTNKQEANGASTAFNTASITPFSIAKALESSSSTKVVVRGAGIVTETAIAVDPYAETAIKLTGSNEVAGLVAAQITTPSATLTFAKPIVAGSKAYVVDLLAKTNTPITNIIYNQNGSVTVAGLTPVADVVVERVPTNYTASGVSSGSTTGGCVVGSISAPLSMMLSLLTLGFFIRRKKSS